MLQAVLKLEPYARHRDWLAAQPDCLQVLADVLLQCVLPYMAAALQAEAPTGFTTSRGATEQLPLLADALNDPCLVPARVRLRGAGALAAVQAAGRSGC